MFVTNPSSMSGPYHNTCGSKHYKIASWENVSMHVWVSDSLILSLTFFICLFVLQFVFGTVHGSGEWALPLLCSIMNANQKTNKQTKKQGGLGTRLGE